MTDLHKLGNDLEKGLYSLFKFCFVTNCKLDEDSITEEEKKTLEELDALEMLENFKDTVTDLLNFKQQCKYTDTHDLLEQRSQLEGNVQKLEADIRDRIRVEQQLKLHIDSIQGRIEEVERETGSYLCRIEELESQLRAFDNSETSQDESSVDCAQKIKKLEEQYLSEVAKVTSQHRQRLLQDKNTNAPAENVKGLQSQIQNIRQIADKRYLHIQKLNRAMKRTEVEIKDKEQELDKLRGDYANLNSKFEMLKDNKYLSRQGENGMRKQQTYNHLRSMSDAEQVKSSKVLVRKETLNSKERPISASKRRTASKHMRSSSEFYRQYQKFVLNLKIPCFNINGDSGKIEY